MRTSTDERFEGRGDIAPDPERLKEGFERRVSEFAAAARRIRAGSDPKAIHDLRVASRRVIAGIRLWRDLVPTRARRAATRELRKLRRRTGRARELEVHVALLEERHPRRGAAARSAVGSLLERLRERLGRRRRSAARRVSPKRLKRVLRLLEDAGAALRARLVSEPGVTRDALAVERRNAAGAIAALGSASEHPDDVSLHDARILVKKWRYTLECLREAVPGVSWRVVRPLRRIQGLLGAAHDLALLRQVLEHPASAAAPPSDDDELRLLAGRLEQERLRAVRRFQRLSAALVGWSRDGARSGVAAEGVVSTAEPTNVTAMTRMSAAEPVDGGPAAFEATGDRRVQEDPRDERWDRIATWLERTGRRN